MPLSVVLASLCLLTAAQMAGAQSLAAADQTASERADAAQSDGQAGTAQPAPTAQLQEVTVTGSRVITNGNDSPTPLTVVTGQQLTQLAPTSIANALNDLPVMSGSKTQDSNPTGGASPFSGGNAAANQLNLRDLGITSTLVMLDGQRIVPSLFTDTLDVDLLPELLVQRVDVVTGGASAVYGSDAIAGVVNYVLNHDFNGVTAEGQYGISTVGDDKSNKVGIAAGTSLFGDSVHIEGSFEHYDDDGLPYRSERPQLNGWGVPGGGSAADPYALTDDLRLSNYTYGGLITSGPMKGSTFSSNGVLTPFVNGTPTGTSGVQVGGGGVLPNFSLLAPEAYDKFFGRMDFNVSNNIHGHAQALFSDKTSYANDIVTGNTPAPFAFTNDTFSTSNAFLSPAVQSALSAGGATTFTMSKAFGYQEMPPQIAWSEEQQSSFNAGLDGKVGRFNWGADINYGRSTLYTVVYNEVNPQNLSAALDAVDSNGQTVCNVTVTNPGADPGCVPLNPFGPTAANAAAFNYIDYNPWTIGVFHMYDVNAHITGDLFNTWAGPVVGSLSAEWRQLDYQSWVSQLSTQYENCTGLRYNCSTAASIGGSLPFPAVHLTVTEPALEFEVPLAKNLLLAKSINLNLATRAVDYSTVGSYWPWKIGPEWQITDSFRIRATYSRDISAPTLFELFQPHPPLTVLTTGAGTEDTLLDKSYPIANYNLGNPNLKAEIGTTKTIGFVWQPPGTGFSMSTDYYRITIDNYILQAQGFQASIQNACYASGGSSPYCQLISRPSYTSTSPTNLITATYTEFFNIAALQTWGDDLELDYATRALGRGFSFRLLSSYQPHLILSEFGTPSYDLGDAASGPTPFTAHPSLHLVGMLNVGLTNDLTLGLDERWRNSMKFTGYAPGTAGSYFLPTDVPFFGYIPFHSIPFHSIPFHSIPFHSDLNLDYRLGLRPAQLEVYLNVTDLFNTFPPPATLVMNQLGPGLGMAAGDDPVGRYFNMGLRVSF